MTGLKIYPLPIKNLYINNNHNINQSNNYDTGHNIKNIIINNKQLT